MKNKTINIALIASLVPHLFCCVLPIVLSVVGLIAPNAAHYHIIPHYLEPWLFVFSAAMLVLSWYLVMRKCACECDSCGAAHDHQVQKIILGFVTLTFIISIILHFMSQHHH